MPLATTLKSGRTARITWGETTADLDNRIMPADMRLQLLDPEYVLFNELSAAGVEEDDYQIVVTDSLGEFTMRMKVRLSTVKTLLFPNLEVPVTELYAYCGLANLKTIDAVTLSSSTFNNTFRYLLASSTIGQDIDYVVGAYPENVNASGAVLDLMRLNRLDLIYEEEGRKRDNAESQLQGILEALDVAMWNGMDGRWHVKHRFSLGEYVTGRGPQRYIHASASLVALSTLQMETFSADAGKFTRSATKHIDAPIQAVEIEQGPDVNNRFVNVNLVKYGDFEEGWVSSTEHIVWEGGSAIVERSTDSFSGTYALQINAVSPATVRQDLGYFSGGQPIRFHMVGKFGHELTSGGSGGSVSSKLRLVFDPYDAAESPYYATASGWTTTPTDYNLTDTANPFGSGVSYQDIDIEVPDSLPSLDGLLYVQFTGDTTGNWVVRVDDFEVRLVDEGYATEQQFKAVFHRLDNNTNPATKGDVVRQRRVWFPGTLWVDTDNNTIRDLSVPMIQADTDGAGDWQEAGYWTSEIQDDATQYDDIARWSAESRIEQQQDPLEVIEAEILGVVPPEKAIRFSGANYAQVYCDIDLATERTKTVMVKKQRVYSSDAPFAEAGTIFFTSQASSANDLVTGNSLMRRNTDGSTETLYTFTGTEPTSLCVDQTDRWVFVVQGLKIWRMRFDGSEASTIFTHGGGVAIGGIDYMTAGTYNGYLFYGVNITGSVQDRVYRVDKDGDNDATVATSPYDSTTASVVIISSTTILCQASFSNLTMLTYPAAGGGYTAVNTNNLASTKAYIAADVSGDRYWTMNGSTLEESNSAGDAYTSRTAISNCKNLCWDATGARLLIASNDGIHYRAGGAINTDLTLTPATGGSGTTGNYGTNGIVAIQ